jgi:predicted  nucleic acid-binding Zn-ribbon protein
MRDQIEILGRLRHLDDGIQQLTRAVRARETDLQRTVMEETMVREAFEREKARLGSAEARHRDAELEVKSIQERKAHFEQQLHSVKTNVEYQALLREIAAAEQKIGEWEDKILEAMEEEEGAGRNIARMEKEVGAKEADSAGERKRFEDEKLKTSQRIDELNTERTGLVQKLQGAVRSKYERLCGAKGQTAIVAVREGTCGGCHYQLPPQAAAEVRQGERLVHCEGCGRILVAASPTEVGTD